MADISKIKLPDNSEFSIRSRLTAAIPKGTVDSTSTSTAFTATIEGITELYDGVCVWITNNVVASASECTIDINGLGAKPMYSNKAASTRVATGFALNITYLLVYNSTRVEGGCWDLLYDNDTTYSPPKLGIGYGTCSTAESTAAKTATMSNYALTTGGIVAIKFTNAVPANATLSINSKTAKYIYYKGAKITADVIKAGDIATFVYSSYYHLISIDRWGDDIEKNKTDIASLMKIFVDSSNYISIDYGGDN